MDSISCTSYAKINLFLEIQGKRPDGYHEISSLFQEVSFSDDIAMRRIQSEYSVLKSNNTRLPFGKRNLCIKACEQMREDAGWGDTVEISLTKRVPLGSGLGGGSSNAAAVISGLNRLFDLGLSNERLSEIGLKVGSDVPFFIHGGTAVARGRGEIITPMPRFPKPIWLVLVKPRKVSVSSGNAYEWVRGYRGERTLNDAELERKIADGDFDYILDHVYNAFEHIVIQKFPILENYRRDLEEAGCLKVGMTGSGSTHFGICESEEKARAVAACFADRDDLSLAGAFHTI